MNYHIYRAYLSFKKINRKKLPLDFWLLMLPLFGYLVSFILAGFLKKPWMIIIGLVCVILFLGVIFNYDKKLKENNRDDFINKKKEREALFEKLKSYRIDSEERVASLKNWLKMRIENYEKRVKITWAVFSTITFSGAFSFLENIVTLLGIETTTFQDIFTIVIWVLCLIVVSFLLALGLYSSEYFDYKNMKTFLDELQDILDYNLYEETQEDNEQNENEDDNIELIKDDENVETENKPKTKKCKMKMGRKITIEILKYDYTGDSSAES